jgi:hypothetical protein
MCSPAARPTTPARPDLRSEGATSADTKERRILIDIDEQAQAAAQDALHTEAQQDTIDAALREVAAMAARQRDLKRLISGRLPDLERMSGLCANCGGSRHCTRHERT